MTDGTQRYDKDLQHLAETGHSSTVPDCPFGRDLEPYWTRRFELFSRFDEGIQLDREALYTVKPELAALEIAHALPGQVVFDPFCGAGGSAIGFARGGKSVLAADTDESRLAMAEHNARIYGVEHRIKFIHGDGISLLQELKYNAIYLDPDWGGPSYSDQRWFHLESFIPNGRELLKTALSRSARVALTVPCNFQFEDLKEFERQFFCRWFVRQGKRWFGTVYFWKEQ